MLLIEKKMNLFDVDESYHLAHCISSDCKMGAGIAVAFQDKFKMRDELLAESEERRQYPTVIRVGRVYNLITKRFYYNKPTYCAVLESLSKLKDCAQWDNVKRIAMPRIASGLDGLNWDGVRNLIERVFADTDIEILVCYQ